MRYDDDNGLAAEFPSPEKRRSRRTARAGLSPCQTWQGLAVCAGRSQSLALADWLEELAVYGTPRNPLDPEIAYQLSLAIENWYLVKLAIRSQNPSPTETAEANPRQA